MKKLFALLTVFVFILACSDNIYNSYTTIENVVETGQVFEGKYELENNGYIELIQNDFDEVFIINNQKLITINFDGGLAFHPIITQGLHLITDNKIKGFYKPLYDQDINDVEVDGQQSTNINGRHDTYFEIYKSDNLLHIHLVVYSDVTPHEILVDRIIRERN